MNEQTQAATHHDAPPSAIITAQEKRITELEAENAKLQRWNTKLRGWLSNAQYRIAVFHNALTPAREIHERLRDDIAALEAVVETFQGRSTRDLRAHEHLESPCNCHLSSQPGR